MTFKSNKQRKCVMAQLNNDSKSDRLKEGMKIKRKNYDNRKIDISKGNYMVVDENNKIESGLKGISKEEAEQIKKDIVERRSKRSEQIYNREFGRSKNLKVVEINSKYPAKHQGYDIREDTYGSNEKRFIVSKKGIDVARVNSPNEAIDKINSGKIKLT